MRCIVFLLALAACAADIRTKPETKGRVTTWLEVSIADKPAEQGIAEVTLTLHVSGPKDLEVQPNVNDAVSGWNIHTEITSVRSIIAKNEGEVEDSVAWKGKYTLKQTKPGKVTLPTVQVKFREGPDAAWETVEWPNLLREVRGQPTPVELVDLLPIASRWRRWAAAGLIASDVLVGAGVVWLLRLRRPRQVPLTSEQRALRDLDAAAALMGTNLAAAHERMADTVLGFFAERFGLPATHQTTAEFLEAVSREAPLPETLREFFERCDLVKFAGVRPAPEECRRTAEMARAACGFAIDAKPQAANLAAAVPTPGR